VVVSWRVVVAGGDGGCLGGWWLALVTLVVVATTVVTEMVRMLVMAKGRALEDIEREGEKVGCAR
jgi:hypothetical protein